MILSNLNDTNRENERLRTDLLNLIGLLDLTSLEGSDTEEKIAALAVRAANPAPGVPPVAAVCVYPTLVPAARKILAGTGIKVASVAGAFPSGLSAPDIVVADVTSAVELGAEEIDIVMNRSLFLAGEFERCQEIMARQILAAGVPVKVILETGELNSLENIAQATKLAIDAGAAFVKTSTGKIGVGATPEAVYTIAKVVSDHVNAGGYPVGIKVSGGVRTAGEALGYVAIIREVLGDEWISQDLTRIGASTLLTDICDKLTK